MAIFRRDNGPPAARASNGAEPAEGARAVTRIAAGTRVEGVVSGATDLVIEGEVHGEIRADAAVTVASGGRVLGDVRARSVLLVGTVEGDVRGEQRVEIAASGALTGDVSAPKVALAEGAFLKGKIEMSGGESGAQPRG